jgi:hypothetical protein
MTEQTGDPRAMSRPAESAPQASAWFEVNRLGGDTSRLRLGGLFRTAWLAALCNQLAHHRLSIDRAHARLAQRDAWIAELHLVSLPGAADPSGLPYVELIESDHTAPTTALALDSYQLVESGDHGGTLLLTIEAEDALGLLGSLLDSLARIELFPIEVHIETRAGRAYDCLWLAAEGRTPPTAQARDALQRVLTGCARPATREPPRP